MNAIEVIFYVAIPTLGITALLTWEVFQYLAAKDFSQLQGKLDQVKGENKQMEDELAQANEKIKEASNNQAEIDNLTKKFAEANAGIQQRQEEISQQRQLNSELEKQLAEARLQIEQLQNTLTHMTADKHQREERLEELQARLEDHNLEDKIRQQNEELAEKVAQVENLEEQLANFRRELESTENQLEKAENENQQLQQQLETAEARIAELQKQLDDSTKQLAVNIASQQTSFESSTPAQNDEQQLEPYQEEAKPASGNDNSLSQKIAMILEQIIAGYPAFEQAEDYNNLLEQLQASDYYCIDLRSYLWLVGWCHTGGKYKAVKKLAQELCQEMFGFIPEPKLKSKGKEYDLKQWRRGKHQKLPASVQKSIITQHNKKKPQVCLSSK